jgi:hypothetical protein
MSAVCRILVLQEFGLNVESEVLPFEEIEYWESLSVLFRPQIFRCPDK